MTTVTVTYSPQDDKLRVYFATRQPDDVLEPLRQAGFRWAGAQECWFAVWTPEREDAALGTGADGIDDEESSLEDRAEARAERFEGYSANAARERDQRLAKDRQTCELLNGQPILVGHHSEKAHRSLLRRMWRNFEKAGEANKRADYWASRAGNGIRWAAYKEKPGVRARRIKTLEADARRNQRTVDKFTLTARHFAVGMPFGKALAMANDGRLGLAYGTWSALDKVREQPDAQQAEVDRLAAAFQESSARHVAHCNRWLAHLAGRIAYEREQLAAQGGEGLLAPKPHRQGKGAIPLRNVAGGEPMTKAQYAAIHKDYKGTRIVRDDPANPYRVRTSMVGPSGSYCGLRTITLTDAPIHEGRPVSREDGRL